MELDARLLITLGGMLISVITSFMVTRQKCLELEAQSKKMQKNISELYNNLEKNNIATQVAENKVSVLTSILSPEKREQLHRSLERIKTEIEQLQRETEKIMSMHNGRHPNISDDTE